jgi:ABC-type sugar transport system permease subunit
MGATTMLSDPKTLSRSAGDRQAVRRSRPWRKVLRRPQFWFGLAVLAPTFVWYILFGYFPILRGLWLAVVDYDFVTRQLHGFSGLRNFDRLLLNPLLFTALQNTLLLAVMQFVGLLPLGLLLATCLVNLRRGRGIYQPILFLPVVVSLVAISLLFLMLMDPQTGTFNQILDSFGLPTSQWLASPDSALASVAGINVWKALGFYVLLLTAGMLNIPTELHDAARVDGVNELQRFWYITIPLMAHTLVLVVVLLAIGSLQEYTSVVILTGPQGGPGNSTYVMNLLIVQEAFSNMRFGVAAAAAFIEFVLVFTISIAQLKLFRPNWSY